ncbi:hypothetical protein J3Q64DRAFT_1766638 [Phycomyces blakesleeanus]|uniref:Uncharacterized protein n=2 Tax=Phycomyces blakesleeanus TaxID=4837 RepID=A0A162U050_PHYB8|nr:hypothetical protein PHYBLDRAFT_182188 [Phycomyces blakesleeanus NRRL 1555(-)]OAD71253.1 hypothetical protein PHYBLDRAFT_182188 [Phycomyces blakesleeanus NRRL 1555(-)]|eukprot:XP_018289293.1 hypothetical protein PHYBLDRAFT_182188 [Phycomyces blakesleeanus NRRL 1555(-)]
MKNACVFFSPRTVTLFLALFGITTHLASVGTTALLASDLRLTYFTGLSLLSYSLLSIYACYNGVAGVIQKSPRKIEIYSWYYCFDTLIQTLFSVGAVFFTFYADLGLCQNIFETSDDVLGSYACDLTFNNSIWFLSAIILANVLTKVYLAFVISSCARDLSKQLDEERFVGSNVIVVPSPAALAADEEKVIYVAGHEFVPYNDEKKN